MLDMGVLYNEYVYLLEVPEKYTLSMSFYDWVDQIFKEQYPYDEPNFCPIWKNLYNLENVKEIQTII